MIAIGVAACGEETPASPTDRPPATRSAVPVPSETSTPTTRSVAPTASPVGTAAGLRVDEGLLSALPTEVDGLALEFVPEAAEQIAADPNLRRDARGVAVGMVLGLEAEREDFAVASIVELAPDVFDEAFYADWRASYDAAACDPAGGVSRRAETAIDGRPVFIATCVEGVRLYHVHLPDPDRIISITSVGERRLGEKVIEGIEAPD